MSGQEDALSREERRSRRAMALIRVAAPVDLKNALKHIPLEAKRHASLWERLSLPRIGGLWPYGLTAAATAAIVAFVIWRSPHMDRKDKMETIADTGEVGTTLADFWSEEGGEDDEL